MAHQHINPRPTESRPFHFETRWRVTTGVERVWEVLSDISAWPTWWPGMHRSHMLGDGEHASLTVQSPLGVRLRLNLELVGDHPPRSAEFTATGDLRGTGHLTLQTEGATTLATITWCVVTRHRLLGALRPIASWSHGRVMAAGQRGLRLACEPPAPPVKRGRYRSSLPVIATGIPGSLGVMRVPPPVWAGTAGLTQLLLARRARPTGASISTAAVVGAVSAGLGLGAVLGFRSRGTTVDPMDLDHSQALVTEGVFAWTRNPMYLGLAGMLAAHAIYRRSPASALPVLGFALAINRWQIPAEEAALARTFGADFAAYRYRVPRWVLR